MNKNECVYIYSFKYIYTYSCILTLYIIESRRNIFTLPILASPAGTREMRLKIMQKTNKVKINRSLLACVLFVNIHRAPSDESPEGVVRPWTSMSF